MFAVARRLTGGLFSRATTPVMQIAHIIVPTARRKTLQVLEPAEPIYGKGETAITCLQKKLYEQLDPTGKRRKLLYSLLAGDNIRFHFKDGTKTAGRVVAVKKKGLDSNVLIRNIYAGLGVELRYHIFSPKITNIEIIQKPVRHRYKHAKHYYLRGTKQDVGKEIF